MTVFSDVGCRSGGNLYHGSFCGKMAPVDVAPSNIRLILDGLMILVWVLTRVNGAIIEPIGDGAAKSVNEEACIGANLLEPCSERVDVFPPELQTGRVLAEDHMVSGVEGAVTNGMF